MREPQTDGAELINKRRKLSGPWSAKRLETENRIYAGTGGVSAGNACAGFRPAYFNESTCETVLSRFADGRLAPIHVLEGLPESWVAMRDEQGAALEVCPEVVAGFMRDGVFYTRKAAAAALSGDRFAARACILAASS